MAQRSTPTETCEICTENPFKYKCPACKLKYCSVVCYKKHKESCSSQQQQTTPQSTAPQQQTTLPSLQPQTAQTSIQQETKTEVETTKTEVVESLDTESDKTSYPPLSFEDSEESDEESNEEDDDESEEEKGEEIEEGEISATLNQSSPQEEEEEDGVIPVSKLQRLESNPEIVRALKDPALQELIRKIDASDNPVALLKEALQNPNFSQFANQLLSTVT